MTALLEMIDACNGEIRIKACRYRSGWYCLVAPVDPTDKALEAWDDLTGGDNEYFAAERFFDESGDVILRVGETPSDAMSKAMLAAERWLESQKTNEVDKK